jgi:WhiB family redox-sensing transcriptional regulator
VLRNQAIGVVDFNGRVLYASGLMPDWTADAACRGRDIAAFFPEDDRNRDDPVVLKARVICGPCPVKAQCLEWAFANPSSTEHGIYAGTTGEERKQAMKDGTVSRLLETEATDVSTA